MAEHTPGPWGLGGETIDDMIPVRRYDTVLALVFSWPGSSEAEARANANLIATAPALLDACKAAAEFIRLDRFTAGNDPTCNCNGCRTIRVLEAAIAQVDGTAVPS